MPVVKGSKTQEEYEEYQRTLEPVWNYGLQLKSQMKDIAKADSIMQIVETVYKEKEDSAFMVFARKNPSSYIALNHIYNKRAMDKYPFEKYSKMAEALTLDKFKGRQWLSVKNKIQRENLKSRKKNNLLCILYKGTYVGQ